MKQVLYLLCLGVSIACAACGGGGGDGNYQILPPAGGGHVPRGYALVWSDEFDRGGPAPDDRLWWFESGTHGGWGNGELQNYAVPGGSDDTTALVSDGTLKIIARKRGGEVVSARMNSRASWRYGYFEARLKLPSGRGTWPAFWMLPAPYTPDGGEIDIMEAVGANPNYVSASAHTTAGSHSGEILVLAAESAFHVYALEWTADSIRAFVDGEPYFTFHNDKAGNAGTWPFDSPFYLKLNLAWGGTWGGMYGVDESALPAVYEADYVRVYQK
jgi:beta-glucanase (GH16 family)